VLSYLFIEMAHKINFLSVLVPDTRLFETSRSLGVFHAPTDLCPIRQAESCKEIMECEFAPFLCYLTGFLGII
jgi:hypothetical protein